MATKSNLKTLAPFSIKSLKAFDFSVFIAVFSLLLFASQPGWAEVERQTDAQLDGLPHSHLNVWLDRSVEHKGVIVAMHGLIMHGGVFDTVASSLAEKGFIVMAADAISSARPGARRENAEAFIKRMKQLEEIASSREGVKKSYAIQAGREVRVFVEPEKITDVQMMELSRDIARQYEKDLDYPGQIKVHIIRETRAVEYAK